MKNIYITFCLFICVLFSNCKKKELTKAEIYNKKANELISQILQDNNCSCMIEISEESLIESNNAENPRYDIRSSLIKELKLKSDLDLDNLVSESKNFNLDIDMVKKHNIKILKRKDLLDVLYNNNKNIFKTCTTGIIGFHKPIFDKTYKKAVIDIYFAFCCTKELPLPVYEYINGKWKIKSRRG